MKMMKKFLSVICVCSLALSAYAGELSIASPAGLANPTDEIDSSFSQAKNTNWILHRLKWSGGNKDTKKDKKVKVPEYNKEDYITKTVDKTKADETKAKQTQPKTTTVKNGPKKTDVKNNIQENRTVTAPKKQEIKTQSAKTKVQPAKTTTQTDTKKEKITETKPAEKVINKEAKEQEKEEKQLLKKEEEQQRYKELEALTETYRKAVALYTDNNIDEAMKTFVQIPEDKRTAEIWLLMGNILMDKGKKDEAVFMYGRAILTEPRYYKAYYNLGNVYLNDDKFNMAIEQYKMAGKYNPNSPYVFYNLGCAYLKAGDLRKAKNAFIRALEINNQVADFHYNLAYTYKKLGKEKLAKTYLKNYNKLTGEID